VLTFEGCGDLIRFPSLRVGDDSIIPRIRDIRKGALNLR
jgi:hypothetical protein